jgi:hypothetical protein
MVVEKEAKNVKKVETNAHTPETRHRRESLEAA